VLVEGDALDTGPEMVAERIQAVLAEPFVLDGPDGLSLPVRASIGVAIGARETAEDLIRDADVALYQAKAGGKDRYVVFRPEMQVAVEDRLSLEMDLRDALERDELYLVYQPIFDLRTVTPKGVEALLRWNHPTRGVVPPMEFVPLAEELGLIVPIGRFVLEKACTQAAEWHASGYPIDVAVNVSARQLESSSFIDDVRQALDQSGLPPTSLTLEITETTIMRDPNMTAAMLREIKSLGVKISIDDVGTGYSSLSYLRHFSIDSLKIDSSFITRVSETNDSAVLIHTLIQLGKALGIETLAEGIEEEGQLARLQREQCDSGQGYLFAKPLEPEAIVAFFAHQPALSGEPRATSERV